MLVIKHEKIDNVECAVSFTKVTYNNKRFYIRK